MGARPTPQSKRSLNVLASFHIVEYRKPAFSPPKRLAGRVAGLHFWRPLNIGGDFAWFREHPSRWSLYPRLKPDFRRWAFFAVWEEEAALEQFLALSEPWRICIPAHGPRTRFGRNQK